MWFLCRKTHVWWEKVVGFSVGFPPNNAHTVEVVKFLDTHNNAHNGQRNIDATWHRVSWDDWTVRQSVVNYFVQPCYWHFVCVPWPSWYPKKVSFHRFYCFWPFGGYFEVQGAHIDTQGYVLILVATSSSQISIRGWDHWDDWLYWQAEGSGISGPSGPIAMAHWTSLGPELMLFLGTLKMF